MNCKTPMTYHEQLNSTDDQSKKDKIRKVEAFRKEARRRLVKKDMLIRNLGKQAGKIDRIANEMIEKILAS